MAIFLEDGKVLVFGSERSIAIGPACCCCNNLLMTVALSVERTVHYDDLVCEPPYFPLNCCPSEQPGGEYDLVLTGSDTHDGFFIGGSGCNYFWTVLVTSGFGHNLDNFACTCDDPSQPPPNEAHYFQGNVQLFRDVTTLNWFFLNSGFKVQYGCGSYGSSNDSSFNNFVEPLGLSPIGVHGYTYQDQGPNDQDFPATYNLTISISEV